MHPSEEAQRKARLNQDLARKQREEDFVDDQDEIEPSSPGSSEQPNTQQQQAARLKQAQAKAKNKQEPEDEQKDKDKKKSDEPNPIRDGINVLFTKEPISGFIWTNIKMIYGSFVAKGKSTLIAPATWDNVMGSPVKLGKIPLPNKILHLGIFVVDIIIIVQAIFWVIIFMLPLLVSVLGIGALGFLAGTIFEIIAKSL